MKKYLSLVSLLAILALCFSLTSEATVLIDVNFDNNSPFPNENTSSTYSGAGYVNSVRLALSGGASMDHITTGGWNDTGAAKFFPPTVSDSYCGLGAPTVRGNYSKLNIRYLVNFGSQFAASITDQIKNGIILKSSNPRCWFNIDTANNYGGDQFTLGFWGTVAAVHGGDYTCGVPPSAYHPNPGGVPGTWPASYSAGCNDEIDRCSNGCGIFYIADHLNEWICIEMEATSSGRVALYIWTSDRSYNGLYLATNNSNPATLTSIDKICGYFNGAMAANPNNYYIIDEVVVADEFIGPPEGFFEDTPLPQPGNTGLPWNSNFETGDTSDWNGWSRGTVALSAENPNSGTSCTRSPLTDGTLNDNYLEHYFGDHVKTGLDKVEEVYLQLYSKFSSGYTWPTAQSHKIAILNLTNGTDWERRYQVFIYVNPNGAYMVDHSYIGTWQFFGLPQNVGTPATVNFDTWDKLKLYVRLNTPGNSDGIVKLWVNDVLKADYTDLNLRQNTLFGVNKLILSTYTSHQSGSDGVQWFDDWTMATEDIEPTPIPQPPTSLRIIE